MSILWNQNTPTCTYGVARAIATLEAAANNCFGNFLFGSRLLASLKKRTASARSPFCIAATPRSTQPSALSGRAWVRTCPASIMRAVSPMRMAARPSTLAFRPSPSVCVRNVNIKSRASRARSIMSKQRNPQASATLARPIGEFARGLIAQGKIVRTCLRSVNPFLCLCPFVFAPLCLCLAFIFRVARAVPVNSSAKLCVSCDINLNGAHQPMPTIARVIHPHYQVVRIAQ